MAFKFRCPKCLGIDYSVVRDNRTFTPTRAFELIFSCRCGKQLFGDNIETEYNRQKKEYEAKSSDREKEHRARTVKVQEAEERKLALRRAMVYQQKYREEQRQKQASEQAEQQAEKDRLWRQKVEGVTSDADGAATAEPAVEALASDDPRKCAWDQCSNIRRKNSKYCSRNCSNRNARSRHKRRGKEPGAAA